MDKSILVAIGASAGGLEALSEFVKALEIGIGASYVVVQHLSPDNTSLLTELISRQTTLPVSVVESGATPLPDQIYITPPNHDIVFEHEKLILKTPSEKVGPKPSVNRMFHSIAANDDLFPVAIVLSGTGTDGASGMAAIKSSGGLTMVQEPSSAKYNGMPLAAIYADAADLILTPQEMANQLPSVLKTGLEKHSGQNQQSSYYKIINTARARSGIDLTHYKPATIERRIERRMHHNHVKSIEEYYDYLQSAPEEIDLFVKDVLIPVTEFFRDSESFQVLENSISHFMRGFSRTDVFRVWIPGCATGEEAFSIAIVLEEISQSLSFPIRYQIFATDLDEEALDKARLAIYPLDSVKELPNTILDLYFETTGDQVKVISQIRDKITFSKHNLIQDPPFSRLHLVSCRNLLIYFNSILQKHVYDLFHYSLLPSGLLFLGKSESISDNNLFNIIDRQHRVYERNDLTKRNTLLPFMNLSSTLSLRAPQQPKSQSAEADLAQLAYQSVCHYMAQKVLVVDNKDELVFISDLAKEFLSFKSHQPSLLIHELVPQPIRAELKAQLFKVRRSNHATKSSFHSIEVGGREATIQLHVFPLQKKSYEQLVIVIVEREEKESIVSSDLETDHELIINQLRHELNATQESLQTVIEELETSNEELQATNEELQSTNEELQSTNEELQTTNEELQSSNEELLTVNDEVLQKNQQLEQLNNDFENLYESSGIPYLILDRQLRVMKLHRGLFRLLGGVDQLDGYHLSNLDWQFDIGNLVHQSEEVMQTSQSIEKVVNHHNVVYRINIRPYILNRKDVGGVLLSFVDITELEDKQKALNSLNSQLEDILNLSPDGILAIDKNSVMIRVSTKAASIFGYEVAELRNKPVTMLMDKQNAVSHEKHVKKYLESSTPHIIGAPRRLLGKHKNGNMFPIELHVSEFNGSDDTIKFISIIRDLTDQIFIENQLRRHQENASVALDNIDDAVIRFNSDMEILYSNKQASEWFSIDDQETNLITEKVRLRDEKGGNVIEFDKLDLSNDRVYFGNFPSSKGLRIFQFRIYPFKNSDSQSTHYILVIHDATDEQLSARQIQWQSQHDPLTGLVNRNQLIGHIDKLIERSRVQKASNILLFLDLDQFKVVNDTCGHKAGDMLLIQLSKELLKITRSRDLLARLGGDEFALVLEQCPLVRAVHIANSIIKLVQDFRFTFEKKIFRVGISIGIAELNPEHTPEKSLSIADHACYAAKESGRNTYYVADDDAQLQQNKNMTHIQHITKAIESDLFEFYFQEIAPSDSAGHEKGYWEVLLRLRGEDGQLILPGTFLPVAERFNHAHLIDIWVVKNLSDVLRDLVLDHGVKAIPRISINLSGQSLSNKKLAEEITANFSRTGLPPEHFVIEITETAAISDFVNAQQLLNTLHEKGIKIALDDFGSGVASFNYIRKLPIDIIKIDGNIIKDIELDELDLTITQSIQGIARVLECVTVAEYVESASIRECLERIQIDYLQGYSICEPISFDDWVSRMGIDSL